jgi:hypothetical protein
MTQVDLGLTGLTRLIRSLALMTVIRNLGRHSDVVNNAANAANVQANTTANPRQNAGVQPPPVQANHAEGSQHRRRRDKVEIARRANCERDHGVPDALDAHNPIQATELQNMHDQELLRRAQ